MWKEFLQFTNNVLGPLSVWLSVLLAVPVLWTFYEVAFGRKWRRFLWLKELSYKTSFRPSILVIDLLPGDRELRATVTRFRAQDAILQTVPEDRIFVLEFQKPRLSEKDIPEFLDALRDKAAEISKAGTDVIHLFYGGPAILATFVGREFANSAQVMLYQYSQGQYHRWGPLNYNQFEG